MSVSYTHLDVYKRQELGGLEAGAVSQAHTFQSVPGDFQPLLSLDSCVQKGKRYVFEGGFPGKQVKTLKDEADAVQPDL